MLDATTVVENVRSRLRERLRVYWVKVPRDRDGFRRQLSQLRGQSPIVPWILRRPVLQHPDSVMSDVLDVLNDAREDILTVRNAAAKAGGVDLVLIGRADLKVADTSSPILLPDWFPVAPGQTPEVHIEDLTWSARLSLSDPALALDDLRRLLHDLDLALTNRLQVSLEADHRLTNSLWSRIGKKNERLDDELPRMKARLNAISNPTAYRPSTAHGRPTAVGLLWVHANSRAPDEMQRTARALADGLRIEDVDVDRDEASLAAVLNRPSNPMEPRVQWAFSLIVAVRGACQLVTAAAHADEYPRFGAQLLQSTSHDLRSFLDEAVAKLRGPEVGR